MLVFVLGVLNPHGSDETKTKPLIPSTIYQVLNPHGSDETEVMGVRLRDYLERS